MTQYVQLSADTTRVVTLYGGPQPTTSDKPGYTTVADTDARYLAFVALGAAQQSFAAALLGGAALTSTGTSALNGNYACDPNSQQLIVAEAVYIQATGGPGSGRFTNGQTTRSWPDVSGVMHTFNTTQFIAFAEAIAGYVDALNAALQTVQGGGAWSAPSNALTIA